MTRGEIIALVKAKMDEISPLGTTITDPQIEAELDNCAVSLCEMLPPALSFTEEETPTLEKFAANKKIDVVCPDDYLKLHRMKLSNWERYITMPLPDDHIRVHMESYEHIASTRHTPFAVLKNVNETISLECRPVGAIAPTVTEFIYVKRPLNAESLPNRMIDMLAWHVSSVVYGIHGDAVYSEQANKNLMQQITAKNL